MKAKVTHVEATVWLLDGRGQHHPLKVRIVPGHYFVTGGEKELQQIAASALKRIAEALTDIAKAKAC
jgi:hypothetical protein